MARRRWTIMVVPRGSGTSRTIEVSSLPVRLALIVFALVVIGASGLTYLAISKAVDLSRLDRMQQTNRLLAQELDRAEATVAEVNDIIASITERDRLVRLLAGLERTDPTVLQAGVGGPLDPNQDDELLAADPLGSRSLSMREDVGGLLRRANILASSFAEARDSLAANVDRLERTPSLRPVDAALSWFTSGFLQDRVHPIHGEARAHEGIDMSADLNTPILATAAGTVIDAGWLPGYGLTVTIDHGDGVVTKYAHCSRVMVRAGQRVERNEQIALVGSTGIATGPHLHYEVTINGRNVNPWNYILPAKVVD